VDQAHSFVARFSFGVAPFLGFHILALHLISHLLSLTGTFHFARLESRLRALAVPTFVKVPLAALLKLD